jgi:hypothetical protein
MKIKLELEDFRFATTRSGACGDVRVLLVDVEGKPFSVWITMSPQPFQSLERNEYFDKLLIEKMEMMLWKVFVDALKAIPEGTNLLDEEVR